MVLAQAIPDSDTIHRNGFVTVELEDSTVPYLHLLGGFGWTLLTKVETSCDRILIAGGANVEAEWEQGPAV